MTKVNRLIIWTLLGGLTAALLVQPAPADRALPSAPSWRLVHSDSSRLTLDLSLPALSIRHVNVDGRPYDTVSLPGFGSADEPGAPQLPQKGWLLAIPPGAEVHLRVETRQRQLIETGRIRPVPTVTPLPVDPSTARGSGAMTAARRYIESGTVYQADDYYPPTIAVLGRRGRLRDQAFIQVLLHPVQYNPVAGLLRYARSFRLVVTFGPNQQRIPARQRRESPVFERVLSRALLNARVGKRWRNPPPPEVRGSRLGWQSGQSGSAYKILVDRDGVYRLSTADLRAVGLPVETIDPRTFKVFNQGRELSILVQGEADGQFDPGDAILFYGQRLRSKYTNSSVYWLTFGGQEGRRMVERDAAPAGAPTPTWFKATLHLERDLFYQPRVPVVEGADHWFWNFWPSRDGSPLSYKAELKAAADGPWTATLRAKVQGFTTDARVDPDHHLQFFLNGHRLQDIFWDGQTENLAEITFPQWFLVEGENKIRIEAPGDTGAFADTGLVNWFEIDYARRFLAANDELRFRFDREGRQRFALSGFTTGDLIILDITDAQHPSRLVNFAVTAGPPYGVLFRDTLVPQREYLAAARTAFLRPTRIEKDTPSMLRSPANGADYIFITHRDFRPEVLPLAEHRAAQGLRTMVVDVQDIYDEFSGGVFTPEAIRDFLAYAYANWQPPAPSYVLLVGDGHFDFKDNLGTGEREFVPPLLALVGSLPVLAETASDNRYVTISGDDNLPDMFIGRLPVNTPDQARAVVRKTLDYETDAAGGRWTNRVMFVADNADAAGRFDLFSDIVADEHLPPRFERDKIYLGITHATGAEVKAGIIAGMNEGRLIVNYIGHSGIPLWAGEKILEVADLESLTNAGRLPVVLSMSSLDGAFHWTGLPALSEVAVRAEGKGAIAWWGGAGGGFAAAHSLLDRGVFDAVFRDGITEIGAATTMGRLALFQGTSGFRNLIDSFVLLGDPALKVALPGQ